MKRYTINYNGFHGQSSVNLMVPDGSQDGDIVEVSPRVAKRLNDKVCGMADCTCGEAIATHTDTDGRVDPDTWYVWLDSYQAGRYPQA